LFSGLGEKSSHIFAVAGGATSNKGQQMSRVVHLTEDEIKRILIEIIERGRFPDESVAARHVAEIPTTGFSFFKDGKVRFQIERHPTLFETPSVCKPSSAYIPEYYTYQLDLDILQVSLIKKEEDEPFVDYRALAVEELSRWGNWRQYNQIFRNLKSKDQVTEFAEKEFDTIDWMTGREAAAEKMPEFKENFLREVKKQFILEMWNAWKSYWRGKEDED